MREAEALSWYHTIELPDGEVTPGFFDHRPYVARYGLPEDLSGKRVLEVGTQDGFWAFELERRGGRVTGIDVDRSEDLDWPPRLRRAGESREGGGFPLADNRAYLHARAALESNVERVAMTAYEVSRERLGSFDFVFVGSMLIHLRDPLLALERLASVCTGRIVVCEPYSRKAALTPGLAAEFSGESPWMTWWLPSGRTWVSMMRCAGFEDVRRKGRFTMGFSDQRGGVRHQVLHARGPA